MQCIYGIITAVSLIVYGSSVLTSSQDEVTDVGKSLWEIVG
jgi:hypothetical protein